MALSNPIPESEINQTELLAFDIAWSLHKYGVSDSELIKEITLKVLARLFQVKNKSFRK